MKPNKTTGFFKRIIILIVMLISMLSSTVSVLAENKEKYLFDKTDVMSDLSSIDGFDVSLYPQDITGLTSPEIITLNEWAYGYTNTDDFALYIYFYNPQRLHIDVDNLSNRVQLATQYKSLATQAKPDSIITSDSIPSGYETFALEYCNDYNELYYKFRIIDHISLWDGKTIAERVNSVERRYDISSVILALEDGSVKDFNVGGSYTFKGYAKGLGPVSNAESTLVQTKNKPQETIQLEVHPTLYRTPFVSSAGANHQTDINSVYFSVPEKYFTQYGNLQKIKAEWFEYKTQPIIIHDWKDGKSKVENAVGIQLNKTYDEYESDAISFTIGNYKVLVGLDSIGLSYVGEYSYNVKWGPNTSTINPIKKLTWQFYNSNLSQTELVSADELKNYAYNYSEKYPNSGNTLPIKNGTISADLFLTEQEFSKLYSGRTMGYNLKEFDANDKFNVLSYDSNHGWLQKFVDYGFFSPPTSGSLANVMPIETNITKAVMNGTTSEISDALLINSSDVPAFKLFYETQQLLGNRTVLFRFADTDYYAEKFNIFEGDEKILDTDYPNKAVISTQTMFFDFRMIQLTFQGDNGSMVVPVVNNPIDIINPVTPGLEDELPEWLRAILDFIVMVGEFLGHVLSWLIIIGIVYLIFRFWPEIRKTIIDTQRIRSMPLRIILYVVIFIILAALVALVVWVLSLLGGLW